MLSLVHFSPFVIPMTLLSEVLIVLNENHYLQECIFKIAGAAILITAFFSLRSKTCSCRPLICVVGECGK